MDTLIYFNSKYIQFGDIEVTFEVTHRNYPDWFQKSVIYFRQPEFIDQFLSEIRNTQESFKYEIMQKRRWQSDKTWKIL